MLISKAFPSNYLKAADLQGRVVPVVIDRCEMEDMPDGQAKPVVHFAGKDKRLVLNRLNSSILVDALGDDTSGWAGKPVELYSERVPFQGRMVDGIRVRVPRQPGPASAGSAGAPARPAASYPPDPDSAVVPFDDDLRF